MDTLGLAMTMENRGHIVACDVSEPRLEGAVRRLRRAGVHNVERHLLVGGDKWAKRRAASITQRSTTRSSTTRLKTGAARG